MREIAKTERIDASPADIWPDIADPERFAEWFAFCDAVEQPDPDTRVLLGSWGAQRSRVTTRITTAEEPVRFAWEHVSEELDGRPAPVRSLETAVEIELEAVEDGTDVTITSRQVPAGALATVVLRLVGKRQMANMLQQSLTMLASRHRS